MGITDDVGELVALLLFAGAGYAAFARSAPEHARPPLLGFAMDYLRAAGQLERRLAQHGVEVGARGPAATAPGLAALEDELPGLADRHAHGCPADVRYVLFAVAAAARLHARWWHQHALAERERPSAS